MIYVYGCENCKVIFERKLKVEERNIPCELPCPYCGEKSIKKLIGASPIHWEFATKTKQNSVSDEEIYRKQLKK